MTTTDTLMAQLLIKMRLNELIERELNLRIHNLDFHYKLLLKFIESIIESNRSGYITSLLIHINRN